MSTLSLADLGPKMRRQLGLDTPCVCPRMERGYVASIPVMEVNKRSACDSAESELPGATWLRSGLHRLRIPANSGARIQASTPRATFTES